MSSLTIAHAISVVKRVTGLPEGKVRTVGASLFVDKPLDATERGQIEERLDPKRIDVVSETEQTRIDL